MSIEPAAGGDEHVVIVSAEGPAQPAAEPMPGSVSAATGAPRTAATVHVSLEQPDGSVATFFAVDATPADELAALVADYGHTERAARLSARAFAALIELLPDYARAYGWPLVEGNLVAHARRELMLSGQWQEDPRFAGSLLAAVAAFGSYDGHSGGSHAAAVRMLTALLRFEPLSPLTANPDEWFSHGVMDGVHLWQSRRQASAFTDDPTLSRYYSVDDPAQTGDDGAVERIWYPTTPVAGEPAPSEVAE